MIFEIAQGWRPSFVISGAPGLIIATIFFITVRDPEKRTTSAVQTDSHKYVVQETDKDVAGDAGAQDISLERQDEPVVSDSYWGAWTSCLSPVIVVLMLAACIRHTGTFIYTYSELN